MDEAQRQQLRQQADELLAQNSSGGNDIAARRRRVLDSIAVKTATRPDVDQNGTPIHDPPPPAAS